MTALYLYGDEDTPEKDFIMERSRIVNEPENVEAKISELKNTSSTNTLLSDDFIQRAGYFIIDPSIPNASQHIHIHI